VKKSLVKLEKFYVIRHYFIHGSAMRNLYIPIDDYGGEIVVSNSETKYQEFLNMIKNEVKIKIPNENFTIKMVLEQNQITDLPINNSKVIVNAINLGENFIHLED